MDNQIENLNEVSKNKSRHLSIFDYYKILQLEYIVAELRTKFYPKIGDKEFWKKVYNNKKVTIEDISLRNKVNNQPLPSIFTDEEMFNSYKEEILGSGGYPKFIYKNSDNEISQGYLDSQYYYAKGVDVVCNYFGETKIAKVNSYSPNSKIVSIKISDNENIDIPITDVTRIL
jgi:hypothetical protein